MRLIDADALKETMIEVLERIKSNPKVDKEEMHIIAGMSMLGEMIDDSPTIEERKMGKWIVTSEFEDCRYVKCNQCKVTQVFYYNKPLTNFCPNCGCQMNGGEEE